MSIDLKTPAGVARPRLSKASTLARFALIGVALAAVAGTFAYLGGWLTPSELTPARFADTFEQIDGTNPGFRRNHAKGVGVSGFFESNGNGVAFRSMAASPTRPTRRMRCAAWGWSFPCPTASCGEPRWSICRCFQYERPRLFMS